MTITSRSEIIANLCECNPDRLCGEIVKLVDDTEKTTDTILSDDERPAGLQVIVACGSWCRWKGGEWWSQ